MSDRYGEMFRRLARRDEGAFVPFVMLGDPDPVTSESILRTLVAAGADAVEVGIPFSDPVADGPVVQAAAIRSLSAGTRQRDCWRLIARLRREAPRLPIGILAYANPVFRNGPVHFCKEAAAAGADAVLIADLPLAEAGEMREAAVHAGLHPVFILPPNADDALIRAVAGASGGFTYVTSRAGVTGADRTLRREQATSLRRLRQLGAAPPLLGFGISRPSHVRAALQMGARGAISGSAVLSRIADHRADEPGMLESLGRFVTAMKRATLPQQPPAHRR